MYFTDYNIYNYTLINIYISEYFELDSLIQKVYIYKITLINS